MKYFLYFSFFITISTLQIFANQEPCYVIVAHSDFQDGWRLYSVARNNGALIGKHVSFSSSRPKQFEDNEKLIIVHGSFVKEYKKAVSNARSYRRDSPYIRLQKLNQAQDYARSLFDSLRADPSAKILTVKQIETALSDKTGRA